MSIIKEISTTYEPETESREMLNHRLAEANKQILVLQERIEILQDIKKRNENTIFYLNKINDINTEFIEGLS